MPPSVVSCNDFVPSSRDYWINRDDTCFSGSACKISATRRIVLRSVSGCWTWCLKRGTELDHVFVEARGTMNQQRLCPSPEGLKRLVSGQEDLATTDAFVEHLDSCLLCVANLRNLPLEDEWLATLRQNDRHLPNEDDQILASVIATLCQQPPSLTDTAVLPELPSRRTSAADWDETVIVDQASEVVSLLSPPDRAGELGVLDRFAVRKVLGVGGMGIVLQAEDRQLNREVAIKIMRPSLAAQASMRERFLREARAMATLEHDHVVSIYQVGQHRGVPYLAMPLLAGETLESKLLREHRLPVEEILKLGVETAFGLAAAHAKGLIHRDIKPSNLWWETRSLESSPGTRNPTSGDAVLRRGRVKLLDFGLVRVLEEEGHLTCHGFVAGTPAYMSPEQARGETLDERSDLFGLGCVLFQACTGQLPFPGNHPTAIILALTSQPPQRVLELNANLPASLALIVERLLEKDPQRRFQSAAEVATALTAVKCEADPAVEPKVHVTPPASDPRTPLERSVRSRFVPSTRSTLVGICAVLSLVVAGVITFRISTGRGMIVLEIDDPLLQSATISIDGQKQLVRQAPDGDAPASRDQIAVGIAPGLAGATVPGILPRPLPFADVAYWQLETRTPRGDVNAVAWSPDGQLVACGTALGHVRIYDARTGQLKTLLWAHLGDVLALDWSNDGEWLVSGGEDGTACLWRVDGTRELMVLEHAGWVMDVAFHPGSHMVATACSDSVLRLWNLQGDQLAEVNGHALGLTRIAWSPDGDRLATASHDTTVRLWNAQGHFLTAIEGHESMQITSIVWSPDSQRLATGSNDATIQLWTRDGQLSQSLQGHQGIVHALAWNSLGDLASASEDSGIRIWDPSGRLRSTEVTYAGRILDLAWSKDGQKLAAGGSGQAIYLRSLNGQVSTDIVGKTPAMRTVAWGTQGRMAVAGDDSLVRVLDESGRVCDVLRGHRLPIHSVSFNFTGTRLASGGWDSRVHIWNLPDGETHVVAGSNPVAWHPQQDILAYSGGREVRLWEPESDRSIIQTGEVISALTWTPDGSQLTTGDFAGNIQHWNANGELIVARRGPPLVFSLAWHHTQGVLASTSAAENSIRRWDRDLEPQSTWTGHSVNIVSMQWNHDGSYLASGGGDGLLRIWNPDGTPHHDLGLSGAVRYGVCFSPDGQRVASAGSEGILNVHHVASGEPEFVCVPFDDGRSLTFTGNGQRVDGDWEALHDELLVVWKVPREKPVVEAAMEFMNRFPQSPLAAAPL